MLKNKPIVIFITILIAVVIIAISVVASQYNKNKPVVPDNSINVVSSNDMAKIKIAYESVGKKQEFIDFCEKVELAVANKLLDGTVTNEEELSYAIAKINSVLATEDWSYIEMEASNYWIGKWELDSKGAVKFAFKSDAIKPKWITDEDVMKYIK